MQHKFSVSLLLSVLTICSVAGAAEWITRQIFASSPVKGLACTVDHDPAMGSHARPNCVSINKIRESPMVEYRFNNRGHRAGMDLTPKAPGTYRIVMTGSSMAEGLWVPWSQTAAARLPKALSESTGRKVEVYDEGLEYGTPRHIDINFQAVLDAQPDMILYLITKWDVENVDQIEPPPSALNDKFRIMKELFAREPFGKAFGENWMQLSASMEERSTAVFSVSYGLATDPTEFVRRYLLGGGTAFLKRQPDQSWKRQLRLFDGFTAEIARKAQRAGIPLVVAVVPPRAAAIMISQGTWPSGCDPYRFGEDVRARVEKYGATYIDILSGYQRQLDAGKFYYPVDGHPNAAGQAFLSRLLTHPLAGLIRSSELAR